MPVRDGSRSDQDERLGPPGPERSIRFRDSEHGIAMNQEVWRKVEELFHAALECAPEARRIFLDRACSGDTDLRQQVVPLLTKEAQAGSFLEVPAIEDM